MMPWPPNSAGCYWPLAEASEAPDDCFDDGTVPRLAGAVRDLCRGRDEAWPCQGFPIVAAVLRGIVRGNGTRRW